MKSLRISRLLLLGAVCVFFIAAAAGSAQAESRPVAKGHKVKVTGPIVVHDGDVLQILDGRDGSAYSFKVTDRTTIRCNNGFLHRSSVMDSAALVPALTIEIEGKGSSENTIEARTIRFSPDAFVSAAQSGDVCSQPAHDLGRSHGVKTLFSSLDPM